MNADDATDKKAKLPTMLRWLERLLIALCGILVGAVGSAKLGANQIGVTVAVPSRANLVLADKKCEAEPVMICPRSIVGIATFANGDGTLTDFARKNTQLWAMALSRCEGIDLQIAGSTSSIPYRSGHLRNNVWLATERAMAVAEIFRDAGLASVEVLGVTLEKELDSLRLFNDRRDGKTDELLAAAARRVDVHIRSLGSCEPPTPPRIE